jgi:DNA-binding transcriptional LysR family regulator
MRKRYIGTPGIPKWKVTFMRDIDLTTLRLLVAVCDHQNMARAAEQEHIAPSAISKRIARLETTLGTPLLERTRRGVQPTPAGLALIEHARTILFTVDRIEQDVSGFGSGVKGNVRLLATPSAIAESLLDDISAFMREPANKDIKVDIEECVSSEVVRSLREGSSAIGICWDRTDLEGLQQRPYRSDQLALAVHAEHPLAGHAALSFEQTLDYEHVCMQPNNAVPIMLQRAAASAGRSILYRVLVSNFDAAFRVVSANLGISVLPVQLSTLYASASGVKMIPLTDAWAQRRFSICFRDHAALQIAGQRMVRHLAARAPG